MNNPGDTLPIKRFALFTPPPADPEFERIRQHLIDTVTREAMRLRVRCAIAHGVSLFDTAARIDPDPDRPNFVTVTAYPLAGNDRPDATTE